MKIPAFIECRDFFIVGQFLTKLKGNPVSDIIFLGITWQDSIGSTILSVVLSVPSSAETILRMESGRHATIS